MSWYYQHHGKAHGPVSAEEIKSLAGKGLLNPDDPIWAEGGDPSQAIPANAAVDFSNLAGSASSVPDWLGDIATLANKGPAAQPDPASDAPDWLEDMRLWIGLELLSPENSAPPEGPAITLAASASDIVPDWLEGWLTPGGMPSAAASKPKKLPAAPAKPAIPAKKTETLAPLAPAKPAIPIAQPVFPEKTPATTPPQKTQTAKAVAEKTLEETGFDLITGRILDADKFNQWKKQKAPLTESSQQAHTNASQFEVFRKARTAIETWVDDEKNRLPMLHADLQEIIKHPGIQAMFRDFGGFGFREKLEKHLAFLLENRRKYHKATKKAQ